MRPLTTVVLVCALSCHRPAEGRGDTALAPEDSVLRSVLTQEATELSQGERLRVASEIPAQFASESDARAWVDNSRTLMGSVPKEMLLSYALANRATRRVDIPDQIAGHSVETVGATALDTTDTPVLKLSRVGFTGRGDSAVVMATRHCGPLCGSSQLLLVVRESERWRIARSLWRASF